MQIPELLQRYQLPDVKAIDENGETVQHLVMKDESFSPEKKIEILQILIDTGVGLNIKNKNKETVLHLAMQSRAKVIVDFLLTCERLRNSVNFEHAVFTSLFETERNKMSKWPKLSVMPESEMIILETESANFVEWILSKDLKMAGLENWALYMAIHFNLQHILPILSTYTTEIDREYELLHHFLRQSKDQRDGHQGKPSKIWYSNYCERYAKKFVKDLLDKGISPEDCDTHGITALHLAIKLDERIDIIEILIEHTINVNHNNISGQTAFYIVMDRWIWLQKSNINYYREIASALIAKGADINESNSNGIGPLSHAVYTGNLRVVEFFSQCNADFNISMKDGEILLHLLVKRNSYRILDVEKNIQLLDLLICKGCKVNAKDVNGLTPIHIAVRQGSMAIIQRLIEHRAHVNCRDNKGWTPLHYTTNDIRLDVAEFLLKSGAYVNAIDLAGNTTLHLVISIENNPNLLRFIKILLTYGADPNEEFPSLSADYMPSINIAIFAHLLVPVDYVPLPKNKEQEFLLMHWIKLKAANLKCVSNVDYERFLQKYKRKFYQECLQEIETLKTNFIDGPVSLYTFLHMDPNSRCIYINNEKLTNLIRKHVTLEKNFPKYAILILAKYHEAVTKKSLMGLAKETWLESTTIDLPDLCLECIFSFLSISDLFYFVKEH